MKLSTWMILKKSIHSKILMDGLTGKYNRLHNKNGSYSYHKVGH
jgi:hypothetical protein